MLYLNAFEIVNFAVEDLYCKPGIKKHEKVMYLHTLIEFSIVMLKLEY